MKRFIEGVDRSQSTMLPECLDDYVDERNPVRAVDTFVKMLDLAGLGFDVEPEMTGRPAYHPSLMLQIYLYGYLNQVQSSRRLERECARNLELIWLTGRLKPDFKTIADFRKDNGPSIRKVCREFIAFCREIDLLDASIVAIDGSKFKAVNAKSKSFTQGKLKRRLEEIDAAIARYLAEPRPGRQGLGENRHDGARSETLLPARRKASLTLSQSRARPMPRLTGGSIERTSGTLQRRMSTSVQPERD